MLIQPEIPWPRLQVLKLEETVRVTAEGLAWLHAPMLDQLMVDNVPGAAGGLASATVRASAERLPRLTNIELTCCDVDDDDLISLATHLPQLEKALIYGGDFGDAGIKALAQRCVCATLRAF